MSSTGIANPMSLFNNMDGDYKAGVLVVAIIAFSLLGGCAISAFLDHCTKVEAFSKGYVSSYDGHGRLIWTKPKE